MKRWLKRGFQTVLVAILIATFALWLYTPSRDLAERETYAALSAFIAKGLTTPRAQQRLVVILDHTSNGGYRFLCTDRLHTISRTERALMFLSSLHTTKFERNFSIPATYKLVPSMEAPGFSEEDQRASYGMWIFSHVTLNHTATRATFYMVNLCGLCGETAFVVMEKQDGTWKVTDHALTGVS
jgi:hypothetical protein